MQSSFRLQKIDRSHLDEQCKLKTDDSCYFFGEYTSGQGYNHSPMNQLIINFKKPITRNSLPEAKYKANAIQEIAKLILNTVHWQKLKTYTWIPIPPSKTKSDSEYDDRLLQILKKLKESEPSFDFREVLLTKNSRIAAHLTTEKRSSEALAKNMFMDEQKLVPQPQRVIIFDDVITTGANFKAAKNLLSEIFPEIPIIGFFIARTKHTID